MRVPRKLSPSLSSAPLSSPPLPGSPSAPRRCLHLSISVLPPPPAAQSAHQDSDASQGPRLPLQTPCPSDTTGMSSEKSGKKQQQNLLPFPPSPDSPPILGPNPPPHPSVGGGRFYFVSVQLSTPPPSPSLSVFPSFLSFQSQPCPLANNMERGQVERVKEVQEWLSISQVLQG